MPKKCHNFYIWKRNNWGGRIKAVALVLWFYSREPWHTWSMRFPPPPTDYLLNIFFLYCAKYLQENLHVFLVLEAKWKECYLCFILQGEIKGLTKPFKKGNQDNITISYGITGTYSPQKGMLVYILSPALARDFPCLQIQ